VSAQVMLLSLAIKCSEDGRDKVLDDRGCEEECTGLHVGGEWRAADEVRM
jgi:hypothetical protein